MYVIFDMDGVIIDSEMVYRRGHMNAARLYRLPEDTMLEVSKRVTGVTIEMEHQTMIEAFGHLPQFDRDKGTGSDIGACLFIAEGSDRQGTGEERDASVF